MENITFAVVSLNPGVDHTLHVETAPQRGTLNRIRSSVWQQGSKGVNVALVLKALGAAPRYYAFTGGTEGPLCNSFTERALIPSVFVPTAAGVRVNTKVMEDGGVCTELNERGGPVSEEELSHLLSYLDGKAPVTCLCGSLPQGVPTDIYKQLILRSKQEGHIAVLDCDGAAFLAGLEAHPDLVKPNREELCRALSVDPATVNTVSDVVMLCQRLRERCPTTDVICTLGGDGAVFVGDEGEFYADAPRVEVKGTAGAGDTFLAAFITRRYMWHEGARMALGFAAAAAAAKVTLEGSALPTRNDVKDFLPTVSVHEINEKK